MRDYHFPLAGHPSHDTADWVIHASQSPFTWLVGAVAVGAVAAEILLGMTRRPGSR